MSAQPTMPTRPNLIPLGLIWGALLGLGVSILATVITTLLTLVTTPAMSDETRGFILFIIPTFYCGTIFLPFVIASGVVGAGFGFYFTRQPRRVSTGITIGMGIITALIVFGIGAALLFYAFVGSFTLPSGEGGDSPIAILIWLAPPLLLLMAGYSLLSSWLNRKLPAA